MTHPIGVMGAMPEETRALIDALEAEGDPIPHGGRLFHRGRLAGQHVVVTTSRCGKVAAAATATELIVRFNARAIVFTGVAGGLGTGVRVGDLVIADELVQHDMDARPLFPRYEIPLLGETRLHTDRALADHAERVITDLGGVLGHPELLAAGAGGESALPRVHRGLIVSGDQFVGDARARQRILDGLPDALCVEMEGAAVAQVAREYGVPVCVARTVSDLADGSAPGAFQRSLGLVAARHAHAIVAGLLGAWPLV